MNATSCISASVPSTSSAARVQRRTLSRSDCERYAPLVRRIAVRLARRLPSHVGLQDLVSCGWMGLTEAWERAPHGMPENEVIAFLSYRVKGAMLDYLRGLDPAAREARNASRRVARAIESLTRSLGRSPESDEIAEAMGLDSEEYRELLAVIGGSSSMRTESIDLDTLELESHERRPDDEAGLRLMCGVVNDAIAALPERLQQIVRMSYLEDMTLREIGVVLGVSESRVCQLLREATRLLRDKLQDL